MADDKSGNRQSGTSAGSGQNVEVVVVDEAGMRDSSQRSSLTAYTKRLWSHRHYIVVDSRFKAFNTHQDMYLGRLWVVLEPIFSAIMYGVLFGIILKTSRGIDNFVGYIIIGTTFFGLLQYGLKGGGGLIQSSRAMSSAFNFPRASTVLGVWLRNLYNSLIPSLVAIVIALLLQWGNWPGIEILAVIPLVILLHLFSLGLIFISARVTAFVPDMKSIINVIGRAWFYISGVFFSIDRYVSTPWLQSVMEANPAYRFLQAIRGAVMYRDAPAVGEWGYLAVWSVCILVFGYIYFWLAEDRYAHIR